MLDLTGLEGIAELEQGGGANGKPLILNIDEIERDPKQPRTIFDPVKLQELAESIKISGVKSPISVQPKGENGKYRLNYGERRWLATRLAGLSVIPAFVDAEHDSVGQFVENVQRDDLKPVEIGEWIQREMHEKNLKQSDIVRLTGKKKDWVSRHVKIGEAPPAIKAVADRCPDYTAMCDLIDAFQSFPEQTLEFIGNGDQPLARKDIAQFVARCKNPSSVAEEGAESRTMPAQAPDAQASEKQEGQSSVPAAAASVGSGEAEKASEQTAKTPATEKKAEPSKAASSAPAPTAQVSATVILQSIYQEQKGGKDGEAIFKEISDEDWQKVYRHLSKDHEKGIATDLTAFPAVLIEGLASGAYAHTGHGLYSMLAFIRGATHKGKITPEVLRTCCFNSVTI